MNPIIIISGCIAVALAPFVAMWVAFRRAPEGWEDATGFHYRHPRQSVNAQLEQLWPGAQVMDE